MTRSSGLSLRAAALSPSGVGVQFRFIDDFVLVVTSRSEQADVGKACGILGLGTPRAEKDCEHRASLWIESAGVAPLNNSEVAVRRD